MAGSARYSEADRRGRNTNQDVTNIGVAGRRTGLRVEGTTRDSDGFENESAFFSPTTTAKKANPVMAISSAKSVRSATKGSGSYDDMDLEASTPLYPALADICTNVAGSARDVATTLRRRSEGPVSASRRSKSPTKTHLNSPALRVRSTSRNPVSPSRSALKSPSRPGATAPIAKVARKLDFSRADPTADSDEEVSEERGITDRKIPAGGRMKSDAVKRSPARVSRASSEESADLIDATAAPEFQADAGSDDARDLPADQDDAISQGVNNDNAAGGSDEFDEYIHDQVAIEREMSQSPRRRSPEKTAKHKKRAGSMTRSEVDEPAERSPEVDMEPVQGDQDFPEAENEPVKYKAKRSKTRASPSEEEEEDEDEEDAEAQPPRKKTAARSRQRTQDKAAKSGKRSKVSSRPSFSPSRATRERSVRTASPQREWREAVDLSRQGNGENDEGVRKSSRFKIAPLAFWRGEKLVYGRGSRRKSSGGTIGLALPEVKEIIHVDLIEGEQKRRRTRPGSIKPRSRKNRRNGTVKEESESESEDDAEGWEETITVEAPVRSFEDQHELVKKVLAIPESDYEPCEVVGQGIFFQKTLSEEPHFAAGVLDIPVGERKPPKPSKQNTMFFFIFRGYVEVKIHEAVFRLRKGAQFTVPRGNFYEIVNVGRKDARLFFSQSTDTLANHLMAHPELLVRPKEAESDVEKPY